MADQSQLDGDEQPADQKKAADDLLRFTLPRRVADTIRLDHVVTQVRADGASDARFNGQIRRREVCIECSPAIADAVVSSLIAVARDGAGRARVECAVAALQVLRAMDGSDRRDEK